MYIIFDYFRSRNGESLEHPTLVFKGIGREESEINIGNMMKYFINFGYYKFGVELTMIALTVAIAIRMDVYSIVYSIWLMVIIFSSRSTTKKVWPFFKWFLIINTIVEYLVRVDVMPSTCIGKIPNLYLMMVIISNILFNFRISLGN